MKRSDNYKSILYKLIITSIVIGAILLRLFHSSLISNDEALLFTEAVKISKGIKPYAFTANWAPFFVSTRHGYFITLIRALLYKLTNSVEAQRWLTMIFGVLSVIITYFLAKDLYREKVGILSSFFVSIFPLHVSLSRGLYLEVPVTCLFLISMFFLIKGLKERKTNSLIISSIFLSLAALTKILALLPVFSILLWLFFERRRFGKDWLKIMFLFSIPLMVWLTWAIPNKDRIISISDRESFFNFVVKKSVDSMKLNFFYEYFWVFSYSIPLIIGGILFAALRKNRWDTLLLFVILTYVIFFFFISQTNIVRFHLLIVPLYFILASRFIVHSMKSKLVFFTLPLTFLFIILSLRTNYLAIKFHGENSNYFFPSTPILLPETNRWIISEFMLSTDLSGAGTMDVIEELKRLGKTGDVLYVEGEFSPYEGFLIDKGIEVKILPPYKYHCALYTTKMCFSEDWEERVKEIVERESNRTNVWIITRDYRMWKLGFGNVRFFDEVNQSKILSKYFKKVYGICYPDRELLRDYCISYKRTLNPNCWSLFNCVYLFNASESMDNLEEN